METYKTIPFAPNYAVSDLGNIKNIITGKVLKPFENGLGYKKVFLYNKPNRIQMYVHRLVALCFIDNSLNHKEVNHIDGNKNNNRLDNLEWCSRYENVQHAIIKGLWDLKGENHKNSKLSNSNVLEIKSLLKLGKSQKELAQKFNVDKSLISLINRGKTRSQIV